MNLSDLVIESARKQPQALAVRSPEQNLTYGELDALANRLSHALAQLGVKQGSRVGIWLDKSAVAIALMQGILRLGAAYVPIDPLSPVLRAATIVRDCQLSAIAIGDSRAEQLKDDLADIKCLNIDEFWQDIFCFSEQPIKGLPQDDGELAYILYTSGSTGKPKGVCLSHQNALAFIKWAAEEIDAQSTDRFSNHAPFHFDLSVLDIYVPFLKGACVCLIPEGIAYIPQRLINFLVQEKITVWYSVPSVLILMILHGDLLKVQEHYLRVVLFAGEVFPIKYLRQLRQHWQAIRLLNLYGPTETNVCTYFEVENISEEQTASIPIGKACCGNQLWGVNSCGKAIVAGEEGELMVSGPTVMLGYWGQALQHNRTYATGDIVRKQDDGNYLLIGRIDSLIKVRGYRIELGEIEAALLSHIDIVEAAVVVANQGMAARLLAFLVAKNNALSLINIKQYCSSRLPRYMIVDQVYFLECLPMNRNGKIDRRKLLESVGKYNS
ncbi:amino acid adenylation domain-containing protein [Rivularia sp. UHCC 0363]|uniref:amino acid adenylation domain-containing protein n=1 Tax=Rivularia sp. UHCC 0363 TaxID=3110244 RepID=UPI002B1EA2EA|nr:amino acid adenylation domain-containing protein [Rivularia sp. UHCC 0363]MEA5596089.1 amino acid adenylation domain-containing protein [Rivularia sp. UHCC 0363]